MRKVRVGIFFLSISVLLFGCASIPMAEEKPIHISKDDLMEVNKDNGIFSLKGIATKDEELPEDFPTTIPIPNDAIITFTSDTSVDDMRAFHVGYKVEDDDFDKFPEVYHDYAVEIGYQITINTNDGELAQVKAESKEEKLTVIINKNEPLVEVLITLLYL